MLPKILVVDDDQDILNFFNIAISGHSYEMVAAKNPEEAIKQLDENQFLCVFLDIVMGKNLTSEKVLSKLKQMPSSPPVIVMSAHMQTDYGIKLKKKGIQIVDTLKKPISKAQILNSIQGSPLKNILIVDDDPDILAFAKFDTHHSNYRLYTCKTSEQAEYLLKHVPFLCGFLDVILGVNQTSDSIIQYIESEDNILNKNIPLIITSQYLKKEEGQRIVERSTLVLDALIKPFKKGSILEMAEKVRTWLESPETICAEPDIIVEYTKDTAQSNDPLNEFESALNQTLDEHFNIGSLITENREIYHDEVLLTEGHPAQAILAKKNLIKGLGPEEIKDQIYHLKGKYEDTSGDIIRVKGSGGGTNSQSHKNIMKKSFLEVIEQMESDDVNRRTAHGITPLMIYATQGNEEIIKALLEKGGDLKLKSPDGKTALHYAAKNGHVKICEILLAKGAKIHDKDDEKREPLLEAVLGGHPPAIEFLVKAGARIQNRYKERTYLHLAIQRGDIASAIALLKNGANPNDKDPNGQTCIQYAKRKLPALVKVMEKFAKNII